MSDRPTPETDVAWDKYISQYTYSAGDLRILAERLERERDEARADLIKSYTKIKDLESEIRGVAILRDEARAAIPDGEWVAYEDHKKVHDAASRLLVAINKQLPIGSFSLISHEYHALKDAIYGKEGAK